MKKALIVGGGFAGCASAHQLELLGGWEVTLVEKSSVLGAGVRTWWFGGHPYTFGPRHFLTENEDVYRYINDIVPLRKLDHRFVTYIEQDNAFYDFPIYKSDIDKMPDNQQIYQELEHIEGGIGAKNLEDYWLKSVGETLYNKFINQYNKKMWMVDDNKKLDTFEWSQKVTLTKDKSKVGDAHQLPESGLIKNGNKEVYEDMLSGYPFAKNGYNYYFDYATKNATILLSTTLEHIDLEKKTAVIEGEKKSFDIIISTISPDILFGGGYGELPFIGRDFHKIVLPMEQCFPDNVFFLYYANDEKFTRLVEFNKFTLHQSSTTLIGMEIPSMNGKHYPLPIQSEIDKAQRYLSELPQDVYSIGRAGAYDYNVDMDDCVEQAMDIGDKL